MQITIIQVLIALFALFALTRSLLRLKDNQITKSEAIFWSMLWILVIIISFLPESLSNIAEKLGISSGISLVVYISILLLFYLLFRIYVRIDAQDQKITSLIREITLSNAKNSNVKVNNTKKKK